MIEFKNVIKEYQNGFVALKNVSFKVASGEFVFIIGVSGSGKTTLTKLLLKEEEVTKGKIIVDSNDLTKMPNKKIPFYRRTLGYVFQDFRLFPNMTVYENIAFAMRVVGEPAYKIKRMVPAIIETIGLKGKLKSYPKELSGGEQQRVALARAVVNNPGTIIADEPTGNLDPKMSLEIMESLERINNMGRTVIVVTHEKALVDHFKKRVLTLRNGVIINDQMGGGYSYRKAEPQQLLNAKNLSNTNSLNIPNNPNNLNNPDNLKRKDFKQK